MKKRVKENNTTVEEEVHKANTDVVQATPSKSSPMNNALSAADYIKLINIRTGKLLAIILVVAFGVYHGLLHLHYGVTPCKGLIVDGAFKGDLWQPWGCMMHIYTQTDAERCFRYNGFYGRPNHFVFIGDSRIRQLYNAQQRLLELGRGPLEEAEQGNPVHHDLHWANNEVILDFIWAPVINGTMIQAVVDMTRQHPSIVVIGSATHTIKKSNNSIEALEEYTRNLTILLPVSSVLTHFLILMLLISLWRN